jgi:hypothetical protein
MDTVNVLRRIDERLAALNLSQNEAQVLAGAGGAIANIRRAVRNGRRKGSSTLTIRKLARVLQCNEAWLLTGEGPMQGNGDHVAGRAAQLPQDDAINLLTAVFQGLQDADEPEARAVAKIVLTAFYTHRSPSGSLLSPEDKRLLLDTVIRSIRLQAH